MNKAIIFLVLLLFSGYADVAFLTGLAISPINRFKIRDISHQNSIISSVRLDLLLNRVLIGAEVGYGSHTYFDSATTYGGGPGVSTETHLNAKVQQIQVTLSTMYLKKVLESHIIFGFGPEIGINIINENYSYIHEMYLSSSPPWEGPEKTVDTIDNSTVTPLLYGANASVRFNLGKYFSSFVCMGYRYSQMGLKPFKDTVNHKFNNSSEFIHSSPVIKCGLSFKVINIRK